LRVINELPISDCHYHIDFATRRVRTVIGTPLNLSGRRPAPSIRNRGPATNAAANINATNVRANEEIRFTILPVACHRRGSGAPARITRVGALALTI
jgi:hypothetical protein